MLRKNFLRANESVEGKVIHLLTVEKRLTRKCLFKKLGFKPNLELLVQQGVIKKVNGSENVFELVTT